MLKDRLLEFIKSEGLNPNQFYVKTGLGVGFLDKVGEKLKRPSVEKISKTFPHWNVDYLQTGEGEKLRNKQQIGDVSSSAVVGANINGSGNNISHNDKDYIIGMIELQKGYQDLLKKKDEHISELLLIVNKLTGNGK